MLKPLHRTPVPQGQRQCATQIFHSRQSTGGRTLRCYFGMHLKDLKIIERFNYPEHPCCDDNSWRHSSAIDPLRTSLIHSWCQGLDSWKAQMESQSQLFLTTRICMELTATGNIRPQISCRLRNKMQRTWCSVWVNTVCQLLMCHSSTEMSAANCTETSSHVPAWADTDACFFLGCRQAVPLFPPGHQNCYISPHITAISRPMD